MDINKTKTKKIYIYIYILACFDVLLTVHLSIFISVINQLDAQNFCFTITLFHVSTCFEHMCSKHVEARNKLIVKQTLFASSWLITEIKKKLGMFVYDSFHAVVLKNGSILTSIYLVFQIAALI